MTYNDFISCVRKHESPHVKALSLPDSCSPHNIPTAFSELIPDIIVILESCRNQICQIQEQSVMALFALQTATGGILSSFPLKANRIFNDQNKNMHFCCLLDYLLIPKDQLNRTATWSGANSVVIDFTTGRLMDDKNYLFEAVGIGKPGVVYGKLPQKILKQIWERLDCF